MNRTANVNSNDFGFLGLAVQLKRNPSRRLALRLYLSSLGYLALLFCAMAIDRAV